MRAACLLLLAACGKSAAAPDARLAAAAPVPLADPQAPAVTRGGTYFNQPERFNRYYTDPAWRPARTVFVSPTGGGTGTEASPMSAAAALGGARPGDQITFLRGSYAGCFELAGEDGGSGTYDAPIVLFAQRNLDGSRGVSMSCCDTGRRTCINLEGADYVAVDGFELRGGKYGVRAVGLGEASNPYESSRHQRGVAILRVDASGQAADPFLTGASDWAVLERNRASGAGDEDGHGMYLSNGSDWNIVRHNDIWDCPSAAFQINADPASTCAEIGMRFSDPECWGPAENGQGQGVSEYILYEGNTSTTSIRRRTSPRCETRSCATASSPSAGTTACRSGRRSAEAAPATPITGRRTTSFITTFSPPMTLVTSFNSSTRRATTTCATTSSWR